jgi:hypothetical protein
LPHLSAEVLSCKLLARDARMGQLVPFNEVGKAVGSVELATRGGPLALEELGLPEEWGLHAFSLGGFKCNEPAVVVCQMVLRNDGTEAWPAATAIKCTLGDPLGFQEMKFDSEIPAGKAFQMTFELYLSPREAAVRCAWALDAPERGVFGTLLCANVA